MNEHERPSVVDDVLPVPRRRVLVAERDGALCSALSRALADDGHEVIGFVDVRQAVHHVEHMAVVGQLPDLVVLGDSFAGHLASVSSGLRALDQELPFLLLGSPAGEPPHNDNDQFDDALILRCKPDPLQVVFAARLLLWK